MIKEKVLIVLLNVDNQYSVSEIEYKISELKELVRASNAEVKYTVVQNAGNINPKYYIGKGKVEEIRLLCDNHNIDTVIFNHDLSGSQMKNLEDIIDRKIVDRTGLILDIFARRAKTKEGKLQVKLAQLEYRLPKLVGFRNYLSREGAGIGTRGPGEQKLEIDRRSIQSEITSIKHKLKNEKLKKETKTKKRFNSKLPSVSLIGYSNSGKSTILNSLLAKNTKDNKYVYSDNLLFATLDTSSRTIRLDNDKDIIISDTVGFISDLPTGLVESFKSTLEEIKESDLLVLVIDSSNEQYENQIQATLDVLKEMKLEDKKILYVFNKIDLVEDFKDYNNFDNEIYISALLDEDIDALIVKIKNILYADYDYYKVLIPYDIYDDLISLIPNKIRENQIYKEDGIETFIYINKKDLPLYKDIIKDE
ncbi:GTPase HflX [uncultured Helcococcus sp.]|uniref:GTPase HflX n=1 Tax=uncultured Helcococcus sp. TaxID=1072508 RepID=UPI002636AFCA|nr:GTPase HflX [uncultured Helcococcus sp.]